MIVRSSSSASTSRALSSRVINLGLVLLSLVAVTVVLCCVYLIAEAIRNPPVAPSPPLDFTLVHERFAKVNLLMPREEVEQLLGPPTKRAIWEPELAKEEENVEHSFRGFVVPRDRVWSRWTDPKNESNSVTILFADDKVYRKLKKGF